MTRKHELRRRVPSAAADGNEADCIETIRLDGIGVYIFAYNVDMRS